MPKAMIPIQIQPGIVKDVSELTAGIANTFIAGQDMRFIQGFPVKKLGNERGSVGARTSTDLTRDLQYKVRDGLIYKLANGDDIVTIGSEGFVYQIRNEIVSVRTSPTQETPNTSTPLRWNFANYGTNLLINRVGGKIIYQVDTTAPGQSSARGGELRTLQSNVQKRAFIPSTANFIMVSEPDRHIIAYGVDGNEMRIEWSDQANHLEWQAMKTNTAGGINLTEGTRIISAIQTNRTALVFTDTAVYLQSFVGGRYTFQFSPVDTNNGIISKNAVADINGIPMWMSHDGFYLFTGNSVQEIPCPVKHYVLDDKDDSKDSIIFACHNPPFNEVAWHYEDSDGDTKTVVYDYQQKVWWLGTSEASFCLERNGIYNDPISFNKTDNYMYFENRGQYQGEAFIETAPFMIGNGDQLTYVHKMYPEFKDIETRGSLLPIQIQVRGRKKPNGTEIQKDWIDFTQSDEYINPHIKARQVSIVFRQAAGGGHFHLGTPLLQVSAGGMR